jgi:hypothetical protein
MFEKKSENFNLESKIEKEPSFESLERLFGENFNKEKTIELEGDLDENNNFKELEKHKAFWTELKNPDTDEVIEGKIYFPKESENVKKILIIEPGYRGDFVLQESEYADDFAGEERTLIVLRHNGLRIDEEEMKDYIHCKEKINYAQKKEQKYIGKDENFDFKKAEREILTVLKSLKDKIDGIDKIDIIGHSWGGRIAVNSISELKKEIEKEKENEISKKISEKIDNLILIGPWLETNKEKLEAVRDIFEKEEKNDCFRNLKAENFMDGLLSSARKLKKITPNDLPKNLRITGIISVEDELVSLESVFPLFNQLEDMKRKGFISLKDFKELLPEKIGKRESQVHDYALPQIRNSIRSIIK